MECSSPFPAQSHHGHFNITGSPLLEEEQLVKELFTDHTAVPLEPCTPCIPGAPGGPYRGKQKCYHIIYSNFFPHPFSTPFNQIYKMQTDDLLDQLLSYINIINKFHNYTQIHIYLFKKHFNVHCNVQCHLIAVNLRVLFI